MRDKGSRREVNGDRRKEREGRRRGNIKKWVERGKEKMRKEIFFVNF